MAASSCEYPVADDERRPSRYPLDATSELTANPGFDLAGVVDNLRSGDYEPKSLDGRSVHRMVCVA
jgi:hypothetical protein